MPRLASILMVAATLGCAAAPTKPPHSTVVATSVTLHRRPLPPGTAVTYAWHGVTHGHVRVEGQPPRGLDLFLRESRTAKTDGDEMSVRWNEKSTRTIVDGGEPTIEVSPLVGKIFRLVKPNGHWWVVDDEGKPR